MLKTDRLLIIDLKPEDVRMWVNDVSLLEHKYNVTYHGEDLSNEFRAIVAKQADVIANDPIHYLWLTFWWFVRQTDCVVLGSACFKSVPREGQVEIGYGIAPQYAHQGYTTEAIKALCAFAFTFDSVTAVIAETDPNNLASQRVLQKCGMINYEKTEKSYWWRLVKP